MVTKCGLVGGVTFYCDNTAGPDGDGSETAPWQGIDEAIQNIKTYQKNMSSYVYLNVRGSNGNLPYPVTESISYLSDFTIRSYGNWDASPAVPETTRPRLVFTGVSEQITHCDNFGTNSIELIAGSIGAIESFEMRYSYIGMTDTDISANLKLVNTRLTSKTMFKPNVNFTGTSTASTIELTKGSVLIVIDSWNLNGLLPSSTIESVYYNGGVLISDRISNYATGKEPSVNEYAIGYYNPATINIKLPSPADRNKKNLWLNWDGDTSANSASFLPVTDCADIGCSASPTIEVWTDSIIDPAFFLWFTIVRVKTPTSKKLFMVANAAHYVASRSGTYPDKLPDRFLPKDALIAFKSFTGTTADQMNLDHAYLSLENTGVIKYDLSKTNPNILTKPMFINSWGKDWNDDVSIFSHEYEPLNNL